MMFVVDLLTCCFYRLDLNQGCLASGEIQVLSTSVLILILLKHFLF